MGPRICVTVEEFLKLVNKERGLVIRGPRVIFIGRMYLLRSGDFYYYTHSKSDLTLPLECEVCDSKQILL